MNGFERTFGSKPPHHFAAHSHHPWPDASFGGHEAAWLDAARLLDRKWDHVFEDVIPAAQRHIAHALHLPDPKTIAFGPSTHSFVVRLLSCFPAGKPVRVLTTSSEFMSFARQIARLEEDGRVVVTRVATEPFDTFEARFADEAARGGYDLVFFSQVFFDSGFAVRDPAKIVAAVNDPETFVVIDGYHAFMAMPVDVSAISRRVFYLAGGYKYAMAGEGCCFLHCPPGYGARGVGYSKDGSRFLGATFDVTALYRFNAVQDWLTLEGKSVPEMLAQVRGIERAFLDELAKAKTPIDPAMLTVPDEARRGRFLAFRTPHAGEIVETLSSKGIITDSRGDCLRIGFGIYHTKDDAVRLAEVFNTLK
jgi:selenocysteine lyase/cysteine desulfurase